MVNTWRTVVLAVAMSALLAGCGVALSSQLRAARHDYANRLVDVQTRQRTLVRYFGILQQDVRAFRSALTDEQAERLNRWNTLQTETSRQAFLESLAPAQRQRHQGMVSFNETLQAQGADLVSDIQRLQADAIRLQDLEARAAERRAFSDRLFAAGLALQQGAAYQQQQGQVFLLQQQQAEQLRQLQQMNQQLETIRQQQRAACVRRAMQSSVPIYCP